MSASLLEQKQTFERAKQDLDDIIELKKNAAFTRYFVRRMSQKRDEADDKCKREKDASVREQYRLKWLALEELDEMMSKDEAACRSTLESMSPSFNHPPRV